MVPVFLKYEQFKQCRDYSGRSSVPEKIVGQAI